MARKEQQGKSGGLTDQKLQSPGRRKGGRGFFVSNILNLELRKIEKEANTARLRSLDAELGRRALSSVKAQVFSMWG
jgi:hypothetical protein